MTPTKYTLTAEQLDNIHHALQKAKTVGEVSDAFSTAMIVLWGYLLHDTDWYKREGLPTIQPTMYHIPRSQWKAIAVWIGEMPAPANTSACLEFVNIGPSSYDDTESEGASNATIHHG